MSLVTFRKALVVLIVAALAFTIVTPAQASPQSDLLAKMNQVRKAHRVPPLKLNRVLTRPALAHSRHLAKTGELDHNGADGKPFWVRIHRAGYSKRKAVGENLGMIGGCSANEADTMVRMWLRSPGHRQNLLSRDFRYVGIAIVSASDCSNTVYTTDFGG